MKVAFVNPPPVAGIRYTREGRCQEKESILGSIKPPLTLLIIAAIARSFNHDIIFLDANAKRWSAGKTAAAISSVNPDLIFISTSTPTVDYDFDCIPPGFCGRIIVISAFAQSLPDYVFAKHRRIYAIAIGDPEYASTMVLDPQKSGGKIKGVIFREGNRLVTVPQSSPLDLSTLPVPAWDLLDFQEYRLPNNGEKFAMIEISRGCPYNCNFCVTGLVHGKRVRSRPIDSIIREARDLKEKFGIRHFYFLADTPFSDKKHIKSFLGALAESQLNIRWMSNARIDTIDEEIGNCLKSSGCWLLAIGVESGSDAVRGQMDKKLRTGDIEKGLSILRKNGIKTLSFFILGAMGETPASMSDTIRFSLGLDTTFANFYPAVPYPGTPFYSYCKSNGYLVSEDYSRYQYSDFVIDYQNGVTRDLVLSKRKEAYLRFYLRPGKLLETLLSMNLLSAFRCGIGILRD